MNLQELLSHFAPNTSVDICTPLFRVTGMLKNVEDTLSSQLKSLGVSRWQLKENGVLEIDM